MTRRLLSPSTTTSVCVEWIKTARTQRCTSTSLQIKIAARWNQQGPFEIACYQSTNNATDPMSWNRWRSFLKGCLGQEVRLPEQRQHVLRVLVCKR
ncbi:hypothetical protein RB6995 [Rhodopirellula baltica SH 1]|uniref:Uncharacterized protein n=1 Tax=Rhodopirellula baltica (strain DSM 10527 / NCIMB 13988 / SH1) TaxID=243090 RepID=Q7UPE3_RHOBA|nr:hypothetical protein RB6995 [Rhodopirellula baltica SH 1]